MQKRPQRRILVMFRVKVASIGMDHAEHMPILVLKKEDSEEAFTLPLTHLEAAAIAAVLKGEEKKNPTIYHNFASFIKEMGYKVLRAGINDLHGREKRARLLLGADSEDQVTIDTKASDAIAMALCFNAPIFIGVEAERHPDRASRKPWVMDESDEGEAWTDLLEKFDTDRFGHA